MHLHYNPRKPIDLPSAIPFPSANAAAPGGLILRCPAAAETPQVIEARS